MVSMHRFLSVLLASALAALTLTGCATAPNGDGVKLYINEVQTTGGESDWIELYNAGNTAVKLDGCFLSDDKEELGKWMFPRVTLKAGEYVVVYADKGKTAEERYSLPFALSADGETVILSDPNGNLLDSVTVPASVPGVSYGRNGEEFAWFASPTPAADNRNGMLLGSQSVRLDSGIRINEYMSRNKSVLYDTDGHYHDWIELYNFSDKPLALDGYTLTDNQENVTKWQFPVGTTLAAGECLVVFCSGENAVKNGELHTSFRLGDGDSYLGLYTADGLFCSGVTYRATEQDVSMAYTADGTYAACRYPTPGMEGSAT